MATRTEQIIEIQAWQATKPTMTDSQWVVDTPKESCDVKYNYQLADMLILHQAKLEKSKVELDKLTQFPDVQKYESSQMLKALGMSGQLLTDGINTEYSQALVAMQWKVEKIKQSIDRIAKEIEIRSKGVVAPDKLDDGSANKNIPPGAVIRQIKS